MQEGSILYVTRWKWFDYISPAVIRQIFYQVVHRQDIWSRSNLWFPQVSFTLEVDQYIAAKMNLDLSSQAVVASQLSRWTVEIYDNWRNFAVAGIIFQAWPLIKFNW